MLITGMPIKSHVRVPCYGVEDFLAVYPQFTKLVPYEMIEEYVRIAHRVVTGRRFGVYWRMAIGLFIAHFATLYLQSMKPEGSSAAAVLAAANSGVVTSESADGVSHSMDISSYTSDLDGWAGFKLTTFGVQFASLCKIIGKGGLYV